MGSCLVDGMNSDLGHQCDISDLDSGTVPCNLVLALHRRMIGVTRLGRQVMAECENWGRDLGAWIGLCIEAMCAVVGIGGWDYERR